MRALFIVMIFLAGMAQVSAQGTVRGVISDAQGETLIGATVVLKSDPGKGTTTDLDGRYSLSIPAGTPIVLVYSFVGYTAVERTITVAEGGVVVENVVMGEQRVEIKEFEVQAIPTSIG